MGINPPFPAMLKLSASRSEKIQKLIGDQSPLHAYVGRFCLLVLGLDMSVLMMAAVKSDRGAEEFHQSPPHPAHHVALAVLQYIRKLRRAGFNVIPVFDGITRHPLKAAGAGATRKSNSAKASAKLEKLLDEPWPQNKDQQKVLLADITRARKGSAHVSSSVVAEVIDVLLENDIPFIVAPFEADWQLVYLFNIGLIHAIVSNDTDF